MILKGNRIIFYEGAPNHTIPQNFYTFSSQIQAAEALIFGPSFTILTKATNICVMQDTGWPMNCLTFTLFSRG